MATHRGSMWHHVVPPPAIPIEFRCPKCPNLINLRQDAGSTVWHKAWHIKNEVKISRLPVSSPFRAFDNSVASICTWKGLEKLECANSPYLCRLEASRLSKLPFLGTKHFVSDFLPFLPFDLKTIPNLLIPTLPVGYQSLPQKHMQHFSRYLCMFFIYIYVSFCRRPSPTFCAKVHEELPGLYAQDLPGHRYLLPRNNTCIPGSRRHKTFLYRGPSKTRSIFHKATQQTKRSKKNRTHSQQRINVYNVTMCLYCTHLIRSEIP